VGFPSPAGDYAEGRLTADKLCGTGPNTRIVQTASGYAVVDISVKPKQQDTVLIHYIGQTDFAKIMGRAFITRDGEAIEGEALDDVVVMGVVTFVITNALSNDDECPVL
jgi:DNA polymerase V